MREQRKEAKLESELVWMANHGATIAEIQAELGLTASMARRLYYACQERGWIYTRAEKILQEGRYIKYLHEKGKTVAEVMQLIGLSEHEYRNRVRAAKNAPPRKLPPASIRSESLETKLVLAFLEKAAKEGLCSSDETVANKLVLHPYRVAMIRQGVA